MREFYYKVPEHLSKKLGQLKNIQWTPGFTTTLRNSYKLFKEQLPTEEIYRAWSVISYVDEDKYVILDSIGYKRHIFRVYYLACKNQLSKDEIELLIEEFIVRHL